MALNCIVVDDSTMQRLSTAKLVSNHPSLKLIAEYRSAVETKSALNIHSIDLIFLEVEIPVLNGFQLLNSLQNKPQIIFTCNKKEFAFKAFDYDPTDYLLKPLSYERFNMAVKKALIRHQLVLDEQKQEGEYIFVKSDFKKRKVYFDDIMWVEANGDYIKVITENTNFLVLSTMKSFEEDLLKDKFLRIHKSYIVNLNRIDRFNRKYVEIGNFEIPLSRNKKEQLVDALKNIKLLN